MTSIGKQSPDIDMGVSASIEYRERLATGALDRHASWTPIGAGDQGMMIGFACNETPRADADADRLAHSADAPLSETRRPPGTAAAR